jgi:lysophospholipase L1-like esterase
VSTQERLILEFMVLPRNPDMIIIFDAWNDAMLPALFGSRPGDPYDQGVLYMDFYSPTFGLKKWLAKKSHLFFSLFHRSIGKTLDKHQETISENQDTLMKYARSTAAVYIDNIRRMLKRCRENNIPCQVFVQPSLDITSKNNLAEKNDSNRGKIVVAAYQEILKSIERTKFVGTVHDLTDVFNAPGQEKWYVDPVHFNDAGHAAVAAAMHPIILESLIKRVNRSIAPYTQGAGSK